MQEKDNPGSDRTPRPDVFGGHLGQSETDNRRIAQFDRFRLNQARKRYQDALRLSGARRCKIREDKKSFVWTAPDCLDSSNSLDYATRAESN